LIWVLYIFLIGTEVKDDVYFNDLDTCLEYAQKISNQNTHQRVAGDKIFVKVYCLPKKKK